MKLYKYVAPQLWQFILQKGLIRFTQPKVLNDPFEMRPCYDSILDESAEQYIFGGSEKHPIWNQLLGFVSTVMDDLRPIVSTEFLSSNNKDIGVLSLTEDQDNLLMWAHYAHNHQGFVIEFDAEHQFFHQLDTNEWGIGYLRKVEYSIHRPKVAVLNTDYTEFLFNKSEEWKYEKEWRMLRFLRDFDDIAVHDIHPIYLFRFPPECVTAVTLGCQMPNGYQEAIKEFLSSVEKYAHTKLYKMELDHKQFKLNLVSHSSTNKELD